MQDHSHRPPGSFCLRLLAHDTGSRVFLAAVALIMVVFPALNLFVPPDSALHVPTYAVS